MKSTQIPAPLLVDFYKTSHREQYPEGTQTVYSTWIPRASLLPNIDHVVLFGLQGFIKEMLIEYWNDHFFNLPEDEAVAPYERILKFALHDPDPDVSHFRALHRLGYLPIEIRAVHEGTRVPLRVPMWTIENTLPEFFWVTNYIETLMSAELWMPSTVATIANAFRRLLDDYADKTGASPEAVPFQGHDFSERGLTTIFAAPRTGAAHLLSFVGTDTVPALWYLEQWYNANMETELIGTSIKATEHSVMCSYGKDQEVDTYRHLITETYPQGFVSIVSDTWDFWHVVTQIIGQELKDQILQRDGRVVLRPDSGNPVAMICGDPEATRPEARKGLVPLLWEIFGGTINEKGFKELDPHIGAIYGDSITLDRAEAICQGLMAQGFASTNVVFGIGSFTYQYLTRDTFGFALKSTDVIIHGEERFIFKDPATDTQHVKKSLTGRVAVVRDADSGDLRVIEGLHQNESVDGDLLQPVFRNGQLLRDDRLQAIRDRLLQ